MTKYKRFEGGYIDDDGESWVTCPECGAEQADMGHNVACEECGHAPMPTAPREGDAP